MQQRRGLEAGWYAATLVFASKIGGIMSLRPLCEERVALFRARIDSEALRLAQKYGQAEQHSYRNARGEEVQWRFQKVEKIERLEAPVLENGREIYSQFTRRSLKRLRDRK